MSTTNSSKSFYPIKGVDKGFGVFELTNEYFKNMKSKDVNDPNFNIKEEVAKARWEKYASIT